MTVESELRHLVSTFYTGENSKLLFRMKVLVG
jgi:hypothetical protein